MTTVSIEVPVLMDHDELRSKILRDGGEDNSYVCSELDEFLRMRLNSYSEYSDNLQGVLYNPETHCMVVYGSIQTINIIHAETVNWIADKCSTWLNERRHASVTRGIKNMLHFVIHEMKHIYTKDAIEMNLHDFEKFHLETEYANDEIEEASELETFLESYGDIFEKALEQIKSSRAVCKMCAGNRMHCPLSVSEQVKASVDTETFNKFSSCFTRLVMSSSSLTAYDFHSRIQFALSLPSTKSVNKTYLYNKKSYKYISEGDIESLISSFDMIRLIEELRENAEFKNLTVETLNRIVRDNFRHFLTTLCEY